MSNKPRVVLVTGASSGIGWATAERFHTTGYRVFGTSRSPEVRGPAGVRMLPLDVEQEGSVRACIAAVLGEAGQIDVLVSNAGRLVFGTAEEVPMAEAQRLFETNFWGTVRMVNGVLPTMRARKSGHVIVVGSLAAWLAIPLNGFYAASKAALARFTEAVRGETRGLGLQVVLVEPSEAATRFWDVGQKVEPCLADYAQLRAGVYGALGKLFANALKPQAVAKVIVTAAGDAAPKPVYRVGALARRMPWMRVAMPARFFERGLRKRFGLAG
jgi:NADP-dependent 3-hydroxy acid dehydrogenase YdfG